MSKTSKATVKKTIEIKPTRDSSPPESLKVEPEGLLAEEWDFRKVRKGQLDAAIYYEYARSCDWVLEVFKRWHEKRLQSRSKNVDLGKWAGRTVAEILNRPDDEALPSEVERWFCENMMGELESHGLIQLFDISPRFPIPFLKVELPATLHMRLPRYQEGPACWEDTGRGPIPLSRWLNSPPEDVCEDEAQEEPVFRRRVFVDLRFAKSKIKKDFDAWVKKLDDSKVEKLKVAKARAAALPWHRLKELAAYRLRKMTTIKYAGAKWFVSKYKEKTLPPDEHGVLPGYSWAGGFSDAVKSAENYIQFLFPKR